MRLVVVRLSFASIFGTAADRATELAKHAKDQKAVTCDQITSSSDCHKRFPDGCNRAASYDAYLNFLKNQLPPPIVAFCQLLPIAKIIAYRVNMQRMFKAIEASSNRCKMNSKRTQAAISTRAALRRFRAVTVFFVLLIVSGAAFGQTPTSDTVVNAPAYPTASATIAQPLGNKYGQLPLRFDENDGQTSANVDFLTRGPGYTLFLTSKGTVIKLLRPALPTTVQSRPAVIEGPRKIPSYRPATTRMDAITMEFVGSNHHVKALPVGRLPGTSNYFIGNDRSRWHQGVKSYASVKYPSLYRGIDVVYYGKEGQLEYDLLLQPGVDPRVLRLRVKGHKALRLQTNGDLVLQTGESALRFHVPVAYQSSLQAKEGAVEYRELIQARYVLRDHNEVGIEILGTYDRTKPVVIDPVLSYSTYVGGGVHDFGCAIAVDSQGNAYITGQTASADFPTTNALNSKISSIDVFVTKLNASGSALVYSTFLGGSGFDNSCSGTGDASATIAVDAVGAAYVTGYTSSTDFPTMNAFQPQFQGGGPIDSIDAFVVKLAPSGSQLEYATYLGGTGGDAGTAIAVDANGNCYVTGYTKSTDFQLQNPLQPATRGGFESFVTSFDPTGLNLNYSTYLGGSGDEIPSGIAVNSAGEAFIVGETSSGDFPATPGAFQTTLAGSFDAFVAKLNAGGTALSFATYFGGGGEDLGWAIALDPAGNAYIAGFTMSPDLPVVQPIQATMHGGWDAFVAELNPTGSSLVFATFLGGSQYEAAYGIAVDTRGDIVVAGKTSSLDFPLVNPIQASYGGGETDQFVAELNGSHAALLFSTYLGGSGSEGFELGSLGSGIAVDQSDNVYVVGSSLSTNYPVTPNAVQPRSAGDWDAVVTKIGQLPTSNAIVVTTNNPNASFSITDGAGLTFTGTGTAFTQIAPPGTYTITFGHVAGFATPTSLTGSLESGGTLNFTVEYVPLVTLTAQPTSLAFAYETGTSGVVQHLSLITSPLPGVPVTVSFTATPPTGWLSAAAVDVRTPMLVDVHVAPGLPPGTYSGQVTVSSPLAFDLIIPVVLTVTPGAEAKLTFPVRNDPSFCSGPGGQCTPFTASTAAAFDHAMGTAYESSMILDKKNNCVPPASVPPGWGRITDFANESADQPDLSSNPINGGVCGTLHGYESNPPAPFLADLNYRQPRSVLYYDGHPGYDYAFSYNVPANSAAELTGVYPALNGCVSYSLNAAGVSAANYHVMAIVPMSSPPAGGHCAANVTSETGYVVFYLHLASYLKGQNPVVCLAPTNGTANCKKELKCPDCPKEGDWVSIDRATPIAYVGTFSNGKWGGVSPHLHLEVDLVSGTARTPLDPYGWWAAVPDPYSPQGDIVNTWLWK